MQGDLEAMNYYMNKVSLATFSHLMSAGRTVKAWSRNDSIMASSWD